MFQILGGSYFRTEIKSLAHKIWMPESNFKLVNRKFVRLFKNLKVLKTLRNLVESKPSKRHANLYFSKQESIFLRKALILLKCLLEP